MTNFLEQLPKRIREIAERVNVCAPEQILTTPKTKFLDTRTHELHSWVHSCTPEDVRLLKDAAAKWLAETPASTDSLFKPQARIKWSRLSFGCPALDRCTQGGVVTRGITEICGAAGVGKTQLLLQLSLCVQLPKELGGFGRGVAYICTESTFPTRRLTQLSKAFEMRYPDHEVNYLGNIFIEHLYDSQELLKCVIDRLPTLLQQHGIGLIVIDSVAAIFRLYTNFIERARDMRQMANALLSYADKFNCAVLCVNQMAASAESERKPLQDVPCLGLQWAHLGRTRLRITKVPKQIRVDEQLVTVRKLEIMYSPETPNEFAEFIISPKGVVDVPQEDYHQAMMRKKQRQF